MNFFQRLFKKKKSPVQYLTKKKVWRDLVPVPKHTRAGKKGKEVFCPRPECSYPTHVYNFAWSALVCKACGATIDKPEWLIKPHPEAK
tara:strand:- start:177 stop:440 length:264 start_codon:yes stop_codon:yes gene_type:complete